MNWGNPMEMVADAFNCNHAAYEKRRLKAKAKAKASRARKAAKAARRRNRR